MTTVCSSRFVLLAIFVAISVAFRPVPQCNSRLTISLRRALHQTADGKEDFDGKDFEDAMKKMGTVWNKGFGKDEEDTLNSIREQQEKAAEEIYRKYPFEETKLPILPDCNNYFSGKFGEFFWHQNSDQVYVYIPLEGEIGRRDVDVKFEARSVNVKINGEEVIEFQCLERIIPDGSFWVFEEDQNGKKYLQLDLEKRFRMINWKSLFGEPVQEDLDEVEKRSEMLKKLFAANTGMGKITGKEPESMDDMMSNEELVKMISRKIYPDPEITETFEDAPDDEDNEDEDNDFDDSDDDEEPTFPGKGFGKVIDTTAE